MVEVLFDHSEIGTGGFAEVFELVALQLQVFTGGDFLEHAGWTHFIAHGQLARVAGLVRPIFVPNPDILAVVEEFAVVTLWYRTKNPTTETRLGVDKVGTGRLSGGDNRRRESWALGGLRLLWPLRLLGLLRLLRRLYVLWLGRMLRSLRIDMRAQNWAS